MTLAITIFTIMANLFLGIAIFLRNPKSATNRIFALYTLLAAMWAFTNYFSLPSSPILELLFRIRLSLVTTAIIPPVLFLLAATFPEDKPGMSAPARIFFWFFTLLIAVLATTPLIDRDFTLVNGNVILQHGQLFLLYAVNVFGFPIAAFLVLLHKFLHSTGRVRAQTKLFMWGIGLTIILSQVAFVLVNVFYISQFAVLAPFFTLAVVGFVAYAITKYQFLDIKLIVIRSVSYILVLGTMTAFYIFGTLVVFRYILPNTLTFSSSLYWFMFITSFVVVSGAIPLYRATKHVIGKYFFKNQYEPEELVFNVMNTMATEVDFDIIAPKVLDQITATIGITAAAILVVEQHRVVDIKNKNFPEHIFNDPHHLQAYEDIFHRTNTSDMLLFEEIHDESLKEVFRGIDIEIIFPIRIATEEVALFFCGSREAGDTYSSQDISVLKILANRIGESVESTRKFRLLKVVDTIKSDFVNSVSHEFRTPLTESRWKIERLLDPEHTKNLSPEIHKELTDVYFSVRWLVESLNQLITAFELETTPPIIHSEERDVELFITDDILPAVQEVIGLKNIKVAFEHPEGIPPLRFDRLKMKDVLSILLENAVKYSKNNDTVTIALTTRESEDGQRFLRIAITDHGIGIKDNDIGNLFSKFYRGENARHTIPNGLGLGLFIAKSLVELHRGKIWAENKGDATTFFVELPY